MGKTLAIGMIAAAAAVASCGSARGDDGGPAIARNYPVGAFDRIEVAGPYEVQVRTGSGPSVAANGPTKLIERMVVEVDNGQLRIYPRRHKGWFNFDSNHGQKVVLTVTVPGLRAAGIAGSGGIHIDRIKGSDFAGEIAGSGDLSVQQVDVGSLSFSVAGSGAATAAKGRARQVKYDIAGSGDIDGKGVAGEAASVSIAGSGNIAAHATVSADVSIVGSGDVAITGGAKCSVSKHGSGNVRCS